MNISSFIEWFIQQVVDIGKQAINILDRIIIYGNISILDFIIAVTILGMFLGIILAIPQNAMNKAENNIREYKAEQRRKAYKERKKRN